MKNVRGKAYIVGIRRKKHGPFIFSALGQVGPSGMPITSLKKVVEEQNKLFLYTPFLVKEGHEVSWPQHTKFVRNLFRLFFSKSNTNIRISKFDNQQAIL